MNTAVTQHAQRQLQTFLLALGDTGIEVIRADQFTQREVAFNAGARGADTNHFLRLAQNIRRALHCLFGVERDQIIATTLYRLTRTVFQVHVTIAKTTTVAEEVVVNGTVIAVFDTTQFTVALAGAGVTTDGTLLADARRKLHVPFTVIALGVRFIGEYAGRANFDQVTGEFAFERTVFRATEVDVVMRAIYAQIRAVRVIFVVTYTAIAGDAAVHFVRDERPQVLIAVGTLGKAVATEAMTSHHGHILQVAVTALFTDRTVVRVVGHQPLHDAFAELLRFFVINRNKGAFGGRCHTRHHQATTRVFRVLILLHRTLAASTDASQRRVPAKVRNIKAERQTSFQQVVRSVDLIFFAVYMNRSHSQHASSYLSQ
ncbi:hypothetical protein CIT292_06207 [Citrobacter youngae ATCC 29220]|uniref:Uncharacterized protein n=1 Tax=Citrobacter youngae ATCC 29220 TaxID=500640 RepID=D4B7B0_9ENTR|nr:hypothetical protein CIT292_06207 [Citrobacter youngae ATCC 29220]